MIQDIHRIPARYIGGHSVILQIGAVDPQGRSVGRRLNYGDVIMMPEREVRGQTLLRHNDQLFDLGAGKVVRKEDQRKSDEELAMQGYEFHGGRADFVTVEGESAEEERVAEETMPVQSEPELVLSEAPPVQEQSQEEEGLQ